MALQVWLPLTSNTNNNGVSSVSGSLTHSSITYEAGKFGKAIRIANYVTSTATYPNIANKAVWSVCCWIKISSSDTFTNYQDFFTLGCDNGGTTAGGLRIEHTNAAGGVQLVTPKSTSYGSNTNSWWTFTSHANMCKDQWGHFVIVNDGTNYKTYFNGVLSNTTAISAFTPSTSKLTGTLVLGMSGTYCWMNDFRIYDHALVENEIRDIYNGLALHWPCNNNGLGYSNPNLIKNTANGSGWSYSTFDKTTRIFTRSTTTTSESFVQGKADLTAGTTYTMSATIKTNGQVSSVELFCYDSTVKGIYSKNVGAPTEWTKVFLTFTPSTTYSWTNCNIRFDNNGSKTSGTEAILYVKDIKVEEGSAVTPWCPHTSDSEYSSLGFSNTIEKDTSGFGRHGTIASAMPAIEASAPRYSCAYKYTGSVNNAHYNTTTDLNYLDNFSWSMWVKTNYTGTVAQYIFTVGRADAGGYGYGLACASTTNCRVHFGTSTWQVAVTGGEWTHIGFTKSGNTVKIYKNGTLYSTNTFGGTLPTYSDGNGVGIGCFHYSSNIYPYYGCISDFRIYATALTDDDIKRLYSTAATVTNNGVLKAYEFIEV